MLRLRKARLLWNLSAGLLLALLAGALLGSSAGPSCGPGLWFDYALEAARRQQFIPQWTPDGALVVYAEGRRIYSAKPDGTDERLISRSTEEYDIDAMPSISPDGSRIVYAAHRESGFPFPDWGWRIATSRIDGSKERILAKDGIYNRNPVWSPDGRHIAWMSSSSVMVMEADGSQPRAVAPGVAAMEFPPRWSPDGQHIAFIGDERERVEGTDKEYSSPLYVASMSGQVLRVAEVSSTPSAAPPAWSPDGRRLAFVKPAGAGRKALYTIAPDGSQPQEVLRFTSAGNPVENLSWSPDGSEIMLNYTSGLAAVDRHGPALQRFDLPAYAMAASWSPDGTRVAVFRQYDATLSIIASAQREPPVYFRPPELADRGYLGGQDPADCQNDERSIRLQNECRALLRIGAALSAHPQLNWNPNNPMDEWEGIRVARPYAVVALELEQRDLTGIIPPELGQLTELEELNFSGNWLTGIIPPELGRLDDLELLDLSYNLLTGSLPGEWGGLARLREARLNNNDLNGAIPPGLGDAPVLLRLYMQYNELSGSIPPELSNLADLKILDLSYNNLNGEIPPELGGMVRLQALLLEGNQLAGPTPRGLWKARGWE